MRLSTFFALCLVAGAAPAASQNSVDGTAQPPVGNHATKGLAVELSTGLQFDEGKYGTGRKVRTWTAPAILRASTGQFQFSASLPYVRVDAPANVVGGGGLLGLPIIIDPTRPDGRVRREGLGDLRLGAAWTLPSAAVGLTLSSQVKLPVASAAKGLGTGELDYAVGAELSRRIGTVIPFVGIGYTVPGDPEGYELRNSLSGRAGAAIQMAPTVRAHLSYGYAQSVSRLVPNEQQIGTGLNAALSRSVTLGLFGAAGLSEGSPDVSAGLQLGFRLR